MGGLGLAVGTGPALRRITLRAMAVVAGLQEVVPWCHDRTFYLDDPDGNEVEVIAREA